MNRSASLKPPSRASVFTWSPLPPRRKLTKTENRKSLDERDLYPNCDANVWLRTCEEEVLEPISGEVSGIIPEWLEGTLIRNGPGRMQVGTEQFEHLFDGSALLHCFTIDKGNVTYKCRFLNSDVNKKMMESNRIVMTEFGTKSVADPCNSIYNRVATIFNPEKIMSDNAMISVYPFGDDLFAFGEGPIIHKININTLDVEHSVSMYAKVGVLNHTSHPHVDKDGTVYNLGVTYGPTGPKHAIISFPKKCNSQEMFDNARIVATVPARWTLHPSYMHTFGMTENYFILVEQPLSCSIGSLLKCRLQNEPLIGALNWYSEETTQIVIICRTTGKVVKTFQAETIFFLHIINQYESENSIVLDICSYRDPYMISCMYTESLKSMQHNPDYSKMFRGRPIRFILPMKQPTKGIIMAEKLSDFGCETPRINYEKFMGRKYRYFYAISAEVDASNPGTIIKVDTETKTSQTWCAENCYPSEPIFVASRDSQFEDDGVILSAMVWGRSDTNRVGLLVLEARTLTELGRVEFKTPSAVPKCLHGWYVPVKSTT